MRTTRHLVFVAAATYAMLARATNAQIDTTGRARFYVTPYAWLSGVSGNVGVGPVAVHVDIPFADVLKVLKFAAMGTAEVRRGPWLGLADVVYVSLGDHKSVAIRGDTGSFELAQHELIVEPMAGYSVGNARWALDLLAGLRYWNLGATLNADAPRAGSSERSGSRSWADALGGARFRVIPARRLHFVAGADAGGGGSKGTWQAHALFGIDVSSSTVVGLAYRYLAVNYARDNFLFDTRTHGPAIGAIFNF